MRPRDTFQRKAFSGQPIDQCVVIDAHGHLGTETAFPLYETSLASIIAAMDRMGIDVFCASPHLVLSSYAKEGNDLSLAAVRQYPERIFAYMIVNLGRPQSIRPELERCLNAGLRAVKIHSQSGPPYSHPNYDVLYQFADSNHLPILAHTEGNEIKDLENNFIKYQNINFILGHSGCVEKENYARVAKKYPNVYLETCVSQCSRGLIEYFVNQGLSDKILWGSDMTFISAGHQIGRVIFADISESDKVRILGKNAQEVLKLNRWKNQPKIEIARTSSFTPRPQIRKGLDENKNY